MSLLLGKRKLFTEAEDDNTSGTENTGGAEDTSAASDATDDTASEENTNEEAPDEGEDSGDDLLDNEEDDGQEEDFSIDDNVDLDADPAEGAEDAGTDSGDSGNDTSTEDEQPEVKADSLKAKDAELFDTLSPDEQQAKIKALKDLYIELYSTCESLMDKFNSISMEYDDANSQFKRIVNTLYGLKKMISDYFLNSFDSRSYIENEIMFDRYLAVLNSIKNVSTDIKNIYKDDISAS